MNRHYLREQDYELPDAADHDEPEPDLDISTEAKRSLMWLGLPLMFMFAVCWYGFYRFVKFLYYLAVACCFTPSVHI